MFQHCNSYNNNKNINANVVLLLDVLSTNSEGEIKKVFKLYFQCLEVLEENESHFNRAILEEKFEEYNQTPSTALLSMKKRLIAGLKPWFRKLKSKWKK